MFNDLTAQQPELSAELRQHFSGLLTPEEAEELRIDRHGKAYQEVVCRMGRDGWLGIGWPKEYGGQGRSAKEQVIFFDEVQRAGAPFPFVTLNTVGPTIMRFGTEEQKSYFLSGILAGEISCPIGYTD